MSLTETETSEMLDLWKAAYRAVSKGQTFTMNGRTLTRLDADQCWSQIQRLSRHRTRLITRQRGGQGGHALARFQED